MAGRFGLLARGRRARRDAGPTDEPDDGAVLIGRKARFEIGQDRRPERRRSGGAAAAAYAASGGSSPDPPLTGGMNATSSPSASAVSGSA
jgi:hypothetical protein